MNILLIRPNRNEADAVALASVGIDSVTDPFLKITPAPNAAGAQRMRDALVAPGPKWLIATSTNTLDFFALLLAPNELDEIIQTQEQLRFAAIGEQTELQLRERGATSVTRASRTYSDSLAEELVDTPPCTVVIPSGNIAMQTLHSDLARAGFTVISEIVYATQLVEHVPTSVSQLIDGEFDGVLLRSPSAARALHHFAPSGDTPVICAGTTTAKEAERLGMNIALVSENPAPKAVAQRIANELKELDL